MNERLVGAIDVLLEQLEEQERSVIETKRMINSLLQRIGKSPRFQDTELERSQNIIQPDMFYGKALATCVREYLEMKGNACTAEEILKGLQLGGFDFVPLEWKEKSRLRNVSISIAKNTSYFHRLPNGTFGLLSWYPDLKKPKIKRTKAPEEEEKIIEEGNEETEKVEKENEN